jgi:hypothetical protein
MLHEVPSPFFCQLFFYEILVSSPIQKILHQMGSKNAGKEVKETLANYVNGLAAEFYY